MDDDKLILYLGALAFFGLIAYLIYMQNSNSTRGFSMSSLTPSKFNSNSASVKSLQRGQTFEQYKRSPQHILDTKKLFGFQ